MQHTHHVGFTTTNTETYIYIILFTLISFLFFSFILLSFPFLCISPPIATPIATPLASLLATLLATPLASLLATLLASLLASLLATLFSLCTKKHNKHFLAKHTTLDAQQPTQRQSMYYTIFFTLLYFPL